MLTKHGQNGQKLAEIEAIGDERIFDIIPKTVLFAGYVDRVTVLKGEATAQATALQQPQRDDAFCFDSSLAKEILDIDRKSNILVEDQELSQ